MIGRQGILRWDMETKICFVEAKDAGRVILGRSAEGYLLREFAAFECVRAGWEDAERTAAELAGEGVVAVIPLDMPLVTAEDIARGAECMKKHKLGELILGDEDRGAKMVRAGGGRKGYFLTSPHFVKVDGAKNLSVVYNQMKERILGKLLDAGVYIADTANTVIDDTALIEPGAEILPFCRIAGGSVVKSGALIEGSHLSDCTVESGAHIVMSHLAGTRVGARSEVGDRLRV